MKNIEELFMDKILYIGEEIPSGISEDKRPKFVLLGTPAELIDKIEAFFHPSEHAWKEGER